MLHWHPVVWVLIGVAVLALLLGGAVMAAIACTDKTWPQNSFEEWKDGRVIPKDRTIGS